jgi:two-component system, NarL family, sensor histidine kinase YdfH
MDRKMRRLLNNKKSKKAYLNTNEQAFNHYRPDIRPLRWFILFWIGIVYLWGCAQLLMGDYVRLPIGNFFIAIGATSRAGSITGESTFSKFMRSSSSFNRMPLPGDLFPLSFNQIDPPLKAIFVALIIVQFCLHWMFLAGRWRQRWYWLYFLLQGACVLVVSLIWSDTIISLGFYLVLIIEALSMLKQTRQIVEVGTIYLALFVLTVVWQLTQMTIWMTLESVLLLVVFIIGWIILSIQQVHARSQLETAHLQLVAYALRIEELTLVNERQRLARELHDTLAQDLVGLTLQLERVDLHLEKKRFERARELVQQAMARARGTLSEAREAIDNLRATALAPDDLLLAVQKEINRFSKATSVSCVAELSALAAVPEHLCEHVLRAITEGLTNVARHARAQHVWIDVQLDEAMLIIEVRDDGIGFESAAVGTQKGHYGLLGLRERARLCGGHLDIESAPGEGTTLQLYLPMCERGELV